METNEDKHITDIDSDKKCKETKGCRGVVEKKWIEIPKRYGNIPHLTKKCSKCGKMAV